MSKNSFVSIVEQIALLNKNAVEIITKLNDVVLSVDSSVKVDYLKEDGTTSSYYLPTVGKLQSDVNNLNNTVQSILQSDMNTSYVFDDKSVKKLMTVDLNKEPSKINGLSSVDTFVPKNNWFFESLSTPMLTVKIDLTNSVDLNVNKVLSRRYIVHFQTDSGGTMTDVGQNTMLDFRNRFINTTYTHDDFTSWLNNVDNTGIDLTKTIYDEQIFEFEYNEVSNFGSFTVHKQEVDSNSKLWIYLDTLNYYLNSKILTKKLLAIGDQLILNVKYSSSRYEIKEIDNSSATPKIRVERIEGYEPIPTAVNILKIYSDINYDKNLMISIGFDEYETIFLKPINTDNNIIASDWSNGIGFYSNDLVLDTNSNVSMAQYYLDSVYDYGNLLKDLVKKSLPSKVGIIPDFPILDVNNFKVVQINKHLNDSNLDDIKKLHSDKENTKSKLSQIESTIQSKLNELLKTSSDSEKRTVQLQIDSYNKEKNNLSTLLDSITKQLTSYSNSSTKVTPKYSIRGFWDFPTPKQESGYRAQEVIQFEIYYRYSSKTGQENLTNSYNFTTNNGGTKQGNFSNWIPLKTDKRKREFDSITDEWIWKVEDVSDASTPNINQLDITISENEKVEIKIRSISEIEDLISDFSDVITIPFPDELTSITSDIDYIWQEASNDGLKLQFDSTLNSLGVIQHIGESFYNSDEYIAHLDKSILTSFKDENGLYFNNYEYLSFLTNRISQLEDMILNSQGVLNIKLISDDNSYIMLENDSVNIMNVNCQKYYIKSGNTTYYKNNIYSATYYLQISNTSKSGVLSFLTSYYTSYDKAQYPFRANQYSGLTCLETKNAYSMLQQDNQWIYFYDTADTSEAGDSGQLYNSSGITIKTAYSTHTFDFTNVLVSKYQNIGLPANIVNPSLNNVMTNQFSITGTYTYYGSNNTPWVYSTLNSTNSGNTGLFLSTVHPYIKNISDITTTKTSKVLEGGASISIPIHVYFKYKYGKYYSVFDIENISTDVIDISNEKYAIGDDTHEKSVKFQLLTSNIQFTSEIKFKIKRK